MGPAILVHLELAVQSTKVPREPILRSEKWRQKKISALRADWSALHTSMHCLRAFNIWYPPPPPPPPLINPVSAPAPCGPPWTFHLPTPLHYFVHDDIGYCGILKFKGLISGKEYCVINWQELHLFFQRYYMKRALLLIAVLDAPGLLKAGTVLI